MRKSKFTRDDLINHFCAVNACTKEEFREHEAEAFRIWEERSKYNWKQEFGEFFQKDDG